MIQFWRLGANCKGSCRAEGIQLNLKSVPFKTPLGLYKASVSLRICYTVVRYLAPQDMGRYPLEYVPILVAWANHT